MPRATVVLVILCHIYGLAWAANKQEVNIETNADDPFITKMYAKEIEDGENAELPLENGHHKHHKGKKKHLHGVINRGYYGGYHGGFLNHHHLNHHIPIGLPIEDGLGIPHGHGYPYHVHPIPHHHHIRIGHAPELPIIYPPHHHHHHGIHHTHFPGYMSLPYPLPMCVIEKDDDKKKDDKKEGEKKKEKEKKSKRQLVPCHYYGPPGAGWGAYAPGWTGSGWGAPYWY